MGMTRGELGILASRATELAFRGRLCLLGRQDVLFTSQTADTVFRKHGIAPKAPWPKGRLDDNAFFKALGFASVESIDFDDFEGATIVHDLSLCIPDHLAGRFDFIIDGGTSEHLCDFRQALQNYHAMLATGGKIIHFVPSSNAVEHGFYSFSPTLFHDYYTRNGWKILDLLLFAYRPFTWSLPYKLYRYSPDEFGAVGLSGALPGGQGFGVCCVAEKLHDATCRMDRVIQSRYVARALGGRADELRRESRGILRTVAHQGMRLVRPFLPNRLYDYYAEVRARLRARSLLRKSFIGSP